VKRAMIPLCLCLTGCGALLGLPDDLGFGGDASGDEPGDAARPGMDGAPLDQSAPDAGSEAAGFEAGADSGPGCVTAHGACGAGAGACCSDSQCIDGTCCGLPKAACTSSSDCCTMYESCNGEGRCMTGLCSPSQLGNGCTTRADCCLGYRCANAGCVPCTPNGSRCAAADECCAGLTCKGIPLAACLP
jgi:hypothetical protein